MVKILIINSGMHEKNQLGLAAILSHLKIEWNVGTIADIPNYDVIYSPSQAINSANYPNHKFIFGPHFSVFPDYQQLNALQGNTHKNSIYIQPSEWVVQLWQNLYAEYFLPIKSFPFPVDTYKFRPSKPPEKRENVMVYFKHRHLEELNQLEEFLAEQNIQYRVFDCDKRYTEMDYLAYLQTCRYGILLDAHESQGFAVEEALACDVPLLVWNAQTMNQEHGSSYSAIPCTSIPYWDPRCGEYFHSAAELPATFQTFQLKLKTNNIYQPRQYILENLSLEKCAERFTELINF